MTKIRGNRQLTDRRGRPLFSLRDINSLVQDEKERIYGRIIPPRLYGMFRISPDTFLGLDGRRKVHFTAPEGLGLLRLQVRLDDHAGDNVFFLELADTPHRQMELAFCVINDPAAARFDVDRDEQGRYNYFATSGRNIPEEIRAMEAGLFPNQTHRGLMMFSEFLYGLELLVDALGMDIIIGEPLTYDNAIRYEKYGFEYLTGRQLMMEIDEAFRPGNFLFRRLDGSTPFRIPGMERSVRGRSWAIHDGIMDRPWDGLQIYKLVGKHAGVNTFPSREKDKKAG